MPFVSLLDAYHAKPNTDSFRVAVGKNMVYLKPGRAMLSALGWQVGHNVDVQIGSGDDEGRLRIATHPDGWKFVKSGGDSTAIVIKVRRDLLSGAPDRLPSTPVAAEISDGAIIASLPWALPGNAEPVSASRGAAPESADLGSSPKGDAPVSACVPDKAEDKGTLQSGAGFIDNGARGITSAILDADKPAAPPAKRYPVTAPAVPEPGAVGRMSAEQTERFVQAIARDASYAELCRIIWEPPARYSQGSIYNLKEKLAGRIAAAKRQGAPVTEAPPRETATRICARPGCGKPASGLRKYCSNDCMQAVVRESSREHTAAAMRESAQRRPAVSERPVSSAAPAPRVDAKREAEQAEIDRFLAEKGARTVMSPEQVAAFLRDSGHDCTIRHEEKQQRDASHRWHVVETPILDGKPVAIDRLYQIANELRTKAGMKPVSPAVPAAAIGGN